MTSLLVFGLTGDLMKKKGIPALFALWKAQQLPADFRVVGLSRKEWNKEHIAAHISEAIGEASPEAFVDLFSIVTGEGENAADVERLKRACNLSPENLFIYLCVSPELYASIVQNLSAASLLPPKALLMEKPFGKDLESARALQELLAARGVPEEKIFRIDHFLAKEAMLSLASFAHRPAVSIEVYLNEALGVEKRGTFYDAAGALRDVGQNHLLEAAAAAIGDRAETLESLHILSPEEIKTHTKRGQYEGYRAIAGVAPESQTETYFRVESWFEVEGKKIPLVIESGKRLPSRREAVVTLDDGEKIIPFESGTNEYETLFADAFADRRGRFVSMREVKALWRFIDPIEKAWRENIVPLHSYKPEPLSY